MKNRARLRNLISQDLSTAYFEEENVVVTCNSSADETR